jgi:hypothetical protein
MLIALQVVCLTVLAGAVLLLLIARRPDDEWRQPPKRLHADFGLEVAMVDAGDPRHRSLQPGADGILQLRAKDALQFRVKVAEDAYVGIWSINSDGSVTQLFPNEREKDHYFRKGEDRLVPKTRADAEVCEGATPFDWVWVQASTRPWDPDKGQREGPFLLFKTDRERDQWGQQRGRIRLRLEAPLAEAVLKFRVVP